MSEVKVGGSLLDTTPATRGQLTLVFWLAGLVIVIDQVTKWMVEARLPLNRSWAPWPEYAHLFQFSHVANTGAAFGLLPNGSLFFGAAAVLVAIVIVVYNFQLPAGFWGLRFALGLQLGGALGNLIDRVRLGHVTDFFDFGPWYIFNVADISIVTGVIILGCLMWLEERKLRELEAGMAASNRVDEEELQLVAMVEEAAEALVVETDDSEEAVVKPVERRREPIIIDKDKYE